MIAELIVGFGIGLFVGGYCYRKFFSNGKELTTDDMTKILEEKGYDVRLYRMGKRY